MNTLLTMLVFTWLKLLGIPTRLVKKFSCSVRLGVGVLTVAISIRGPLVPVTMNGLFPMVRLMRWDKRAPVRRTPMACTVRARIKLGQLGPLQMVRLI